MIIRTTARPIMLLKLRQIEDELFRLSGCVPSFPQARAALRSERNKLIEKLGSEWGDDYARFMDGEREASESNGRT